MVVITKYFPLRFGWPLKDQPIKIAFSDLCQKLILHPAGDLHTHEVGFRNLVVLYISDLAELVSFLHNLYLHAAADADPIEAGNVRPGIDRGWWQNNSEFIRQMGFLVA